LIELEEDVLRRHGDSWSLSPLTVRSSGDHFWYCWSVTFSSQSTGLPLSFS
jgi:hypothetical protein